MSRKTMLATGEVSFCCFIPSKVSVCMSVYLYYHLHVWIIKPVYIMLCNPITVTLPQGISIVC